MCVSYENGVPWVVPELEPIQYGSRRTVTSPERSRSKERSTRRDQGSPGTRPSTSWLLV